MRWPQKHNLPRATSCPSLGLAQLRPGRSPSRSDTAAVSQLVMHPSHRNGAATPPQPRRGRRFYRCGRALTRRRRRS